MIDRHALSFEIMRFGIGTLEEGTLEWNASAFDSWSPKKNKFFMYSGDGQEDAIITVGQFVKWWRQKVTERVNALQAEFPQEHARVHFLVRFSIRSGFAI